MKTIYIKIILGLLININILSAFAQDTIHYENGIINYGKSRCLIKNKTNYFLLNNINRLSHKVEYNIQEDSIIAYRDFIGELITKFNSNIPNIKVVSSKEYQELVDRKGNSNLKDIALRYSNSLLNIKYNYNAILLSKNWKEMKKYIDFIGSENNNLIKIKKDIIENNFEDTTLNSFLNSLLIIDTLQEFIQNFSLLNEDIFKIKVPFKVQGLSTSFKVKITPIQNTSLGILNSMLLPKSTTITYKNRWSSRAMLNFSLGKFMGKLNNDELLHNRIDNITPFKNKTGDSVTYVTDKLNVISSSFLINTNLNLLTRVNYFTEIGAQIGFGATLLDSKPKIGVVFGGSIVLWDKFQLSIGQFYTKYQSISNTGILGKYYTTEIEFKDNNYKSSWKANTFISLGYSIPIFNSKQ